MNVQKLKEKLCEVSDPRRQWGNLRHKLWEILIIALCSTISMGEDYDDMEEFGKEREEWLKSELGLELKHGIPDGDTFERVIERIKPNELRVKLNESLIYVKELRGVIAVDGKTKRSSGNKSEGRAPIHIISAFACENQLVLGEVRSDNKKTEIKEIPKLLGEIDIEGGIVTIDAMGCQKEIAAKIIKGEADYVLGLKKNHEIFHDRVEEHFLYEASEYDTIYIDEKNGSRIEKREYLLETDLGFLSEVPEIEMWVGMKAVGMVKSVVERGGEVSFEIRYFVTSLTEVGEFAYAVRKHWGIENQLHWCLDVVFREDSQRSGKENAAVNMNILAKHALHLIGAADLSGCIKMGKASKKRKRLKSALNPDVLKVILLT